MLSELDNYDWEEAFQFASFSREDVESILGIDEGYNDGDSWLIYGKLKNGNWFYLNAWCDYTGWDCQSGGTSETSDTREHIERFIMTEEDRSRLGIVLPELSNKTN